MRSSGSNEIKLDKACTVTGNKYYVLNSNAKGNTEMQKTIKNRIMFEAQVLREAGRMNPYQDDMVALAFDALHAGWFKDSNMISDEQFRSLQASTKASENQVRQILHKMERIARMDAYRLDLVCFFNAYKILVKPRVEADPVKDFNESEYI